MGTIYYSGHRGATPSEGVNAVARSPESGRVASGGTAPAGGYPLQVWDATTGKLYWQRTFSGTGSGQRAYTVAYSPDGRLIAAGGDFSAISVLDAETGETRFSCAVAGNNWPVLALAFSPDGRWLVWAGQRSGGKLHLWDMARGERAPDVRVPLVVTGDPLEAFGAETFSCLAFSPDGEWLAAGTAAGACTVVRLGDGGVLWHIPLQHAGGIRDIAWSPDGSTIATVGADNVAQLAQAANGQTRQAQSQQRQIHSCAFSPDGSALALAGQTPALLILEVEPRGSVLYQPPFAVSACDELVRWSPDGHLLARGLGRGVVCIDAVAPLKLARAGKE
jgi:hypothetical protein